MGESQNLPQASARPSKRLCLQHVVFSWSCPLLIYGSCWQGNTSSLLVLKSNHTGVRCWGRQAAVTSSAAHQRDFWPGLAKGDIFVPRLHFLQPCPCVMAGAGSAGSGELGNLTRTCRLESYLNSLIALPDHWGVEGPVFIRSQGVSFMDKRICFSKDSVQAKVKPGRFRIMK